MPPEPAIDDRIGAAMMVPIMTALVFRGQIRLPG
jgi:hypothetical protein